MNTVPNSNVRMNPYSPSVKKGGARSLAFALVLLSVGCVSGPVNPELYSPFVQRDVLDQPTACFDAIGHTPGNVPYPQGGECYCTPVASLQARLDDHPGTRGLRVESVASEYDRMNVKTAAHHRACNNACEWGPHVARGGHCLVSPEPGTANYEAVLRGRVRNP